MASTNINLKLASAAEDIKIWQPDAALPSHHISTSAMKFQSVYWSSDLQKVICVPGGCQYITLVSLINGKTENTDLPMKQESTCALFVRRSSSVIGVGSKNGTVQLYDVDRRKVLKSFKTDKTETTCLRFNGNSAYLASGSASGKIFLHNCTTSQSNAPFSHTKNQIVQDIDYSYYHKAFLGAAYYDGTIILWDANTRQINHKFADIHIAPATGIRFSCANPLLFISVGLDKKVYCYDVRTKTVPKSFNCDYPITCLDFNMDGHTVALGSSRGKIILYDLRFLISPKLVLSAHATSINSLAFQNMPSEASAKLNKSNSAKSEVTSFADSISSVREISHLPSDEDSLAVRSRTSLTYEVFSPLENSQESTRTSETSKKLVRKPPLAARDSLAVFSPLESSSQLGLNDTAAITSAASPTQRPEPPVLSRVRKSLFWNTEAASSSTEETKTDFSKIAHSSILPAATDGIPDLISPNSNRTRPPQWPPEKTDGKLHCIPDISCLSLSGMCSSNASKISKDHKLSTGNSSSNEATDIYNETTQVMQPVTLSSPSVEFKNSFGGQGEGLHANESKTLKFQAKEYVDEGHGTGVAPTPATPEAFQAEYLRQCIEDAKEDMMDQHRKLFHQQHVAACKLAVMQQEQIESLLRKYCYDADLVAEVNALKQENQRLKKLFH